MFQDTNTCNKDKAFPCVLTVFDAFFICLSTTYFTSTLMTIMLFPCTEGNVCFSECMHLDTSIPLSHCHVHICAFFCAYWCPLLAELNHFIQDQKQLFSLSKQFFPTISNPLAALQKDSVCPPFHKIPSGALYFFKELDENFKLMDSLQEFHPDLGLPTYIFYIQGRNESSRTHCSAFSCLFVKMIGSNVNYSHGNTVCSTYNVLKRKHLPNMLFPVAFPQLTTWESNFINCWMSRIPPFWKFLVLLAEV